MTCLAGLLARFAGAGTELRLLLLGLVLRGSDAAQAETERETKGGEGEQAARLHVDSHVGFTFWFPIRRV